MFQICHYFVYDLYSNLIWIEFWIFSPEGTCLYCDLFIASCIKIHTYDDSMGGYTKEFQLQRCVYRISSFQCSFVCIRLMPYLLQLFIPLAKSKRRGILAHARHHVSTHSVHYFIDTQDPTTLLPHYLILRAMQSESRWWKVMGIVPSSWVCSMSRRLEKPWAGSWLRQTGSLRTVSTQGNSLVDPVLWVIAGCRSKLRIRTMWEACKCQSSLSTAQRLRELYLSVHGGSNVRIREGRASSFELWRLLCGIRRRNA